MPDRCWQTDRSANAFGAAQMSTHLMKKSPYERNTTHMQGCSESSEATSETSAARPIQLYVYGCLQHCSFFTVAKRAVGMNSHASSSLSSFTCIYQRYGTDQSEKMWFPCTISTELISVTVLS